MRKIILLVLLLSLSGCKLEDVFPTSSALKNKIDTQQQTINALQKEVHDLTNQVNNLQLAYGARIATLEGRIQKIDRDSRFLPFTELSLTDRNYAVVKTNLGNLLFVVEDVAPYANGVKLKLRIGNLNSVTFYGIKMSFFWGKNSTDALNHTKDVDLPTTLPPGYWTTQEVILSPAKADDMGYLSVAATLNQVGLSSRGPVR